MSRGSAIWIATTCHQTSLIRTQTLSALGLSVLCLPQPSCPSAMSFHIFLNSHLPPFTSYCELKQAQTRRCACLQALFSSAHPHVFQASRLHHTSYMKFHSTGFRSASRSIFQPLCCSSSSIFGPLTQMCLGSALVCSRATFYGSSVLLEDK